VAATAATSASPTIAMNAALQTVSFFWNTSSWNRTVVDRPRLEILPPRTGGVGHSRVGSSRPRSTGSTLGLDRLPATAARPRLLAVEAAEKVPGLQSLPPASRTRRARRGPR
jgi:hypothetical protein